MAHAPVGAFGGREYPPYVRAQFMLLHCSLVQAMSVERVIDCVAQPPPRTVSLQPRPHPRPRPRPRPRGNASASIRRSRFLLAVGTAVSTTGTSGTAGLRHNTFCVSSLHNCRMCLCRYHYRLLTKQAGSSTAGLSLWITSQSVVIRLMASSSFSAERFT